MRFSYIEQVTKEKFLRSITSSPPLFIDPADNAVLEQRLAEQKASLKDQKSAVAVQIEQLQEKAKQLVARYDALHSQREELETLPAQVAQLEGEVTTLRAAEDGEMRDVDTMSREPHLNLPLNATYELLGTKEAENDALDVELEAFRQQLPERAAELGKLEAELRPLEAQKMSAVAAAREANRRRDGDGGDRGIDTLEGKARWWGACEKGLGAWLEIEG